MEETAKTEVKDTKVAFDGMIQSFADSNKRSVGEVKDALLIYLVGVIGTSAQKEFGKETGTMFALFLMQRALEEYDKLESQEVNHAQDENN